MDIVLYSRKDNVWKIADFGFSAQGTSKRIWSTEQNKGTSSYRAPEIIKEDAKYNNKVDIWAIGCIFYELVCEEKAFPNDWAVFHWYSLNEDKSLPTDALIEPSSRNLISSLITRTINRDAQTRPSARELCVPFFEFFGHTVHTSLATLEGIALDPGKYIKFPSSDVYAKIKMRFG